jgi:hypothetical protein
MPAVTGEYEALRSSAAVRVLPRDVLRISGSDATSYLQGQCSQDVSDLGVGASADALLLDPRGKIDAFIRVTTVGADEFIVDTDAGFGPVVTTRLERFRLRTKVEIEALDWVCLAVRGPVAAETIVGQPALVIPVEWPGLVGLDLLGPTPPNGPSQWVADDAVVCGGEAWEAARIEAGVPVNGRELVDGTIAAEVGLVDRSVSFTKGCFTGRPVGCSRVEGGPSSVRRRDRPDRRRARTGGAGGRLGRHRRRGARGRAPVLGGLVPAAPGDGGTGHAASPGDTAGVGVGDMGRRRGSTARGCRRGPAPAPHCLSGAA